MLDDFEVNRNDIFTLKNKKMIVILFSYIIFNLILNYLGPDSDTINALVNTIRQQKETLQINDLLNIYNMDYIYQGKWTNLLSESSFLHKKQGYMEMRVIKYIDKTQKIDDFSISFKIIDGEYIDQGLLQFQFICSKQLFQAQVINSSKQTISLKQNKTVKGKYDQHEILIPINLGQTNATLFQLSYVLAANSRIDLQIVIKTQKEHLKFDVIGQPKSIISATLFAVILSMIAYLSFSSLISILKEIYQGRDFIQKYSFFTITILNMWDTVLCLISLVFAFSNQENLTLFMFPAFLMSLIFSNLEPRMLNLSYQQLQTNNNQQNSLCRYNLIHYGSLLLIYPFIVLTNFNNCMIFPQIYHNAVNNIRPNLLSNYYQKLILSRYIIIFYVKCFPYNIFKMKPDYMLGFICLSILLFQFFLLYIQKLYGSKKVIPKFLLPPNNNYDYAYQLQTNVQEGEQLVECSICLTPLNAQPVGSQNKILQVQYKLMKTPCNHKYHACCLIDWMSIKRQCPQCRAALPPLL